VKVGLHLARQIATARSGFLVVRGWDETEAREAEIRERPSKDWKGKRVYAIRCNGTTGKGPHEMWVTEAVLWALIEPSAFVCPFHS
jgi:hypothetical protein